MSDTFLQPSRKAGVLASFRGNIWKSFPSFCELLGAKHPFASPMHLPQLSARKKNHTHSSTHHITNTMARTTTLTHKKFSDWLQNKHLQKTSQSEFRCQQAIVSQAEKVKTVVQFGRPEQLSVCQQTAARLKFRVCMCGGRGGQYRAAHWLHMGGEEGECHVENSPVN